MSDDNQYDALIEDVVKHIKETEEDVTSKEESPFDKFIKDLHEKRKKQFPMTINDITINPDSCAIETDGLGSKRVGKLVSVRPCGEEYNKRTYLGIYIGDAATSISTIKNDDNTLTLKMTAHNPAIFVPELKKVIYGCESWWGVIKSAEDLKNISDADINNVWYVKALKGLTETESVESNPQPTEIVVNTPNGDIKAKTMPDPNYPGIAIEIDGLVVAVAEYDSLKKKRQLVTYKDFKTSDEPDSVIILDEEESGNDGGVCSDE